MEITVHSDGTVVYLLKLAIMTVLIKKQRKIWSLDSVKMEKNARRNLHLKKDCGSGIHSIRGKGKLFIVDWQLQSVDADSFQRSFLLSENVKKDK